VDATDPLEHAVPRVFGALDAQLGFDALYAATVGRLLAIAAWLSAALDRWGWGGAVRAAGAFSVFTALTNRQVDEEAINAGVDRATGTVRAGAISHSRSQLGDAHAHLRSLAVGFALLALLLVLGGAN
jgi:hypothetical protein